MSFCGDFPHKKSRRQDDLFWGQKNCVVSWELFEFQNE
jgi:hypothetical protein